MMGKPMRRAWEVAKNYDKNLRADDCKFNRAVQIIHEEGTTYFFHSAFLMTWKDPATQHDPKNAAERQGEWLIVFTEHQGFHVFSYDELLGYAEFERLHGKIPAIPHGEAKISTVDPD